MPPRRTPRQKAAKPSAKVDDGFVDRLLCRDSRDMSFIPDSEISLVVTSPPYNVGKPYSKHADDLDLGEYLAYIGDVWRECHRVLRLGGRLAINVANTWRQPYIPLSAYIATQCIEMGFIMRGEVVWNKAASVGVSTAWGSWRSASNPTLRDVHEYILIFSKDSLKLAPNGARSKITSEEFTTYTKSVWTFSTASARKEGHPAPFPEELPSRLIKLYTFPGDIVLDPFVGSGSACAAAKRLGRRYVGIDIDPGYIELAKKKLSRVQ
jgi:site-specific DNA-methyltransferase (adenine-specific)